MLVGMIDGYVVGGREMTRRQREGCSITALSPLIYPSINQSHESKLKRQGGKTWYLRKIPITDDQFE